MAEQNRFTDPCEELKALALEYVRQQDLSSCTPAQLLNMYNSVLDKMWEHYEREFGN